MQSLSHIILPENVPTLRKPSHNNRTYWFCRPYSTPFASQQFFTSKDNCTIIESLQFVILSGAAERLFPLQRAFLADKSDLIPTRF